MRRILTAFFIVALTGCANKSSTNVISDPIGIPYIINTTVSAPTTGTATTGLNAEVKFGGFGYGPAKVEFLDGSKVLYTTSERALAGADPQKFNYSGSFSAIPGATYNIRAIATWDYGRGGKIESPVIVYNAPMVK